MCRIGQQQGGAGLGEGVRALFGGDVPMPKSMRMGKSAQRGAKHGSKPGGRQGGQHAKHSDGHKGKKQRVS